MIIYAMIFCSTVLGPMNCRTTVPPLIFKSLEECQRTLQYTQRKSMDVEGRVIVTQAGEVVQWWQCASKRIETWEAQR